MNPRRAERKSVVIRVSLGARAPHYSWFIRTRAARFYYFLVTSQGTAERGVAPLSRRDITLTTTVLHSLHLRAPFFSPPLPPLTLCLSLCLSLSLFVSLRTHLSGFLLPLMDVAAQLPHGKRERERERERESVIFPRLFGSDFATAVSQLANQPASQPASQLSSYGGGCGSLLVKISGGGERGFPGCGVFVSVRELRALPNVFSILNQMASRAKRNPE